LNAQPPMQSRNEPIFFLPPSVTLMIGLCAGLYLIEHHLLGGEAAARLLIEGAFIPARYGAFGVPFGLAHVTSPLTYSLFHASFTHLAVNMVWLAAFGAPLAQRIGSLRFLAFWCAAALGAAALHFAVYAGSLAPLVGASGAVAGMMGAAARFAFKTEASAGPRAFAGAPLSLTGSLTNRTVLTFGGIWMAVNLVSGLGLLSPGGAPSSIAWEAHVGGFLTGFLGLSLIDRR
jgi:membrane associated rhomboid family serine protease